MATSPSSTPRGPHRLILGEMLAQPGICKHHPLLGTRRIAREADGQSVWETEFLSDDIAYLTDHRVHDLPITPAAAFVEMAVSALAELGRTGPYLLNDVAFEQGMFLKKRVNRQVRTVLSQEQAGVFHFQVFSRAADDKGTWIRHAVARVQPGAHLNDAFADSFEEVYRRRGVEIPHRECYSRLDESGLQTGTWFRPISRLWRQTGEALGEIRLARELAAGNARYCIHPAVLNGCFQVLAAGRLLNEINARSCYIPIGASSIWLRPEIGTQLWCRATAAIARNGTDQRILGNFWMWDPCKALVGTITGLQLRRFIRLPLPTAEPKSS